MWEPTRRQGRAHLPPRGRAPTSWRSAVTLHQAGVLAPLSQHHLLTSCLCVTFYSFITLKHLTFTGHSIWEQNTLSSHSTQNALRDRSRVPAKPLHSHPLSVTLWPVARQGPPSMGFSRQEHWSGLPCPPPGHLPDPGVKPTPLKPSALVGRFTTRATQWVMNQALVNLRKLK